MWPTAGLSAGAAPPASGARHADCGQGRLLSEDSAAHEEAHGAQHQGGTFMQARDAAALGVLIGSRQRDA